MPYCSGCGSRYQEGDRICKSCGFILTEVGEKPDGKRGMRSGKKNSKTRGKKKLRVSQDMARVASDQAEKLRSEVAPETTPGPAKTVGPSEARRLEAGMVGFAAEADEIHLGKGIIKPKAVELGVDGFHFIYEEQPQAVHNHKLSFKEPGLPSVAPKFAAELPPQVAGRIDAVNREFQSKACAGPTEDTAKTSPAQNESKPASTEKTVTDFENAAQWDLAGENLDTLLIESLEAELRDLETALDEVRQAESDLVLELEVASKSLESDQAVLESSVQEETLAEKAASEWMETVAPEPGAETITELGEERVITGTNAETSVINHADHNRREAELAARRTDDAPTLLQGRQSWYGIPLPYYYRLTERFLVCVEPNGRSFEYDLTALKKVTVKQSWLGKLLGIGDVELDFNQRVPSRYVLTGIAYPAKFRVKLEELLRNRV
jgi:hypothetical protein